MRDDRAIVDCGSLKRFAASYPSDAKSSHEGTFVGHEGLLCDGSQMFSGTPGSCDRLLYVVEWTRYSFECEIVRHCIETLFWVVFSTFNN